MKSLNLMHVCDPKIAHLRQEPSHILICGFRILLSEFNEIRHPEPSRIRDGVKKVGIWLVIRPNPAFRL
jgi:hypothetical protein